MQSARRRAASPPFFRRVAEGFGLSLGFSASVSLPRKFQETPLLG
jgi:hypothetical protein